MKNTSFKGVMQIESIIHIDARGDFSELYHESKFHEIGIDTVFVQDNVSVSKKGVLRGIHFQKNHPQAKLILPLSGKIFDIITDLRRDSPTFGKTERFYLEKGKGLFVPRGFAHGFLALTEDVMVLYKCDDFFDPNDEGGIIWNDSNLGINWQSIFHEYAIVEVILSEKDKKLPPFSSFIESH